MILNPSHNASGLLYRIGAVSKATGIPVSTLRIWETRYGAFQPIKTEGKQRLYEEHDVTKALLFKQLCNEGHAISAIAKLDIAQLRRMRNLQTAQVNQSTNTAHPLTLAIVGLGLANRIESKRFNAGLKTNTLKVTDVFTDLAAAEGAAMSEAPHMNAGKLHGLHNSFGGKVVQHDGLRKLVFVHQSFDAGMHIGVQRVHLDEQHMWRV